MTKTINGRVIQKHDTEANWQLAVNFIPYVGEIIIYDKDDNYPYERIKVGDGVNKVSDLPFIVDYDKITYAEKESYVSMVDNASIVNYLKLSKDLEGNIYNGTGYKNGVRFSTSAAGETTAGDNYGMSGFIPAQKGDILRAKNITRASSSSPYIVHYDSNKNYKGTQNVSQGVDASGVLTTTIANTSYDIAYIRTSFCSFNEESIITINQDFSMTGTAQIGWLKTEKGVNIAPKSLTSQVFNVNGKTVDELLEEVKTHAENYAETWFAQKSHTHSASQIDTGSTPGKYIDGKNASELFNSIDGAIGDIYKEFSGYAVEGHDHDDDYSLKNHTHTEYSKTGHNHYTADIIFDAPTQDDTILKHGENLDENLMSIEDAILSKQNKIKGAASSITEDNLTGNRVLVSNLSGKVAASDVTTDELNEIKSTVPSLQNQINDILTSGVQPDWNQLDSDAKDYIKNKPFDYEVEYVLFNSERDSDKFTWDGNQNIKFNEIYGFLFEDEYYMITIDDKSYVEKCRGTIHLLVVPVLKLELGDDNSPYYFCEDGDLPVYLTLHGVFDKKPFIEIKKLKIKDTPSHFIKDMYYSENRDYYKKTHKVCRIPEEGYSAINVNLDKQIFKDYVDSSPIKVEWDGVVYNSFLICDYYNSQKDNRFIIGNVGLINPEFANLFSEPFVLIFKYNEPNDHYLGFSSYLSIMTKDTEAEITEHTIRIFDDEHQDMVHQIDKKYIPFNGADWEEVNPSKLSYIKNKPFGKTNEEIIVEYQQWPNTDGEGTNYWGEEVTLTMADMLNLFEIGEKYEVTIEGKTYITECKYFVDNELGTKYNFIGNEKILATANGSEESINKAIDTGENFAFSHVPENGFLFGVVKGFEPKEGVTYGIKKINIDYLPHYYIKDMYYSEINENIFIQEQFIHGFTDAAEMGFDGYMATMINAYPGEKLLVPNQTYKIVWDGVEYECLAITGAPDDAEYVEVYMGNLSPMGGEDTGEPFIIAYTEESGMNQFMIGTPSEGERHKLKVYQGDSTEKVHQIDSKYIPNLITPEDIDALWGEDLLIASEEVF